MRELKLPEPGQQWKEYLDYIEKKSKEPEIKSLTIDEAKIFMKENFKKNSMDHRDYVKAKRKIFLGEWNKEYDKTINIICDYLGL